MSNQTKKKRGWTPTKQAERSGLSASSEWNLSGNEK